MIAESVGWVIEVIGWIASQGLKEVGMEEVVGGKVVRGFRDYYEVLNT